MEASQLSQLPQTLNRVSPNRISTFHICAKKYDYTYRQQIAPLRAEPNKNFDKGNYTHELCHNYYELIRGGSKVGSNFAWLNISSRIQNDLAAIKDPQTKLRLLPVYSIISQVIKRYIDEQSPKIDTGIQVLGIEHELEFKVNELFSLFGYADLIYRDSQGRVRIRDHKSGEKAWQKADAANNTQLIFYATIWYKLTGEVPIGEISYINTKKYVKKIPSYEDAFAFHSVPYTARELDIYFSDICTLIEAMLKFPAVPSYTAMCGSCYYQTPCFAERKGVDPEPVIKQHFKYAPRESGRHVRLSVEAAEFTEDDSTNDESD